MSTSTTTPSTAAAVAARNKRPRVSDSQLLPPAKGSRKGGDEQAGGSAEEKSLRHFSMKVCQVVEAQGNTTYNEVADALVLDVLPQALPRQDNKESPEEKNVRRRVYDALNVLAALEVIEKQKKQVRWLGFPETYQAMSQAYMLQQQQAERARVLAEKEALLRDLVSQRVGYGQLLARNRARPAGAPPDGPATEGGAARIHMPFVVAATDSPSLIDCALEEGRENAVVTFSDVFSLHDDSELLRHMRLHEASQAALGAMLPAAIVPYAAARGGPLPRLVPRRPSAAGGRPAPTGQGAARAAWAAAKQREGKAPAVGTEGKARATSHASHTGAAAPADGNASSFDVLAAASSAVAASLEAEAR